MAEVETQGTKRTHAEAQDVLDGVKVVLLDIEGTTTPITFVKDKLFSYVRDNLQTYLDSHWESEELQGDIDALREQIAKDKEDKVKGVPEIPAKPAAKTEETKDVEMKEDTKEEKKEKTTEDKNTKEEKPTEKEELKEKPVEEEKKDDEKTAETETKEEKKPDKVKTAETETKEEKKKDKAETAETETKEEKKKDKAETETKEDEEKTKEETKDEKEEKKEEKEKQEEKPKEDETKKAEKEDKKEAPKEAEKKEKIKEDKKEEKATVEKPKEENGEKAMETEEAKTAVDKSAVETEEAKSAVVEAVVKKSAVVEAVVKNVLWQMDQDRKVLGLKQLQAHIWRSAYKTGKLVGDVYDDVVEALKSWAADKKVYIYSSGSIEAQKLLFSHTEKGDLTQHLTGYFDLTTGSKLEKGSYTKIAEECGVKTEEVLFLTDVAKEAQAASEAGMKTHLVVREGNAPLSDEDKSLFNSISTFTELTAVGGKDNGEPPEKK